MLLTWLAISYFCLLLVPIAGQNFGIKDLPTCSKDCASTSAAGTGCKLDDEKCLCTKSNFSSNTFTCSSSVCNTHDVNVVSGVLYYMCSPYASSSLSSSSSSASSLSSAASSTASSSSSSTSTSTTDGASSDSTPTASSTLQSQSLFGAASSSTSSSSTKVVVQTVVVSQTTDVPGSGAPRTSLSIGMSVAPAAIILTFLFF